MLSQRRDSSQRGVNALAAFTPHRPRRGLGIHVSATVLAEAAMRAGGTVKNP
jgi:hypothetical protein